MPAPDDRNYYIAKQDLMAFKAWPGRVWKSSDVSPEKAPPLFKKIMKGDRLVGFAHEYWEKGKRQPLCVVTGFYKCIDIAQWKENIFLPNYYGDQAKRKGWVIEGRQCENLPRSPVSIPPIDKVLGRTTKKMGTLIQISAEDYELFKTTVRDRELNPEVIPLLQREPECEQELLAVVARDYQRLGIEKIIRVRTRFPDMLVKLKGHVEEVHLELEFNSKGFLAHESQIQHGRCLEDNKPVAVLCWIDDEPRVHKLVHKVYELRTLLPDGKQITW